MFKNIPFMATRDDVEATVLSVRGVDSSPRPDSCLRIEPSTEVELILMPRETETYLGGFPNEQCVDTENIRTKQVDKRIR